MWHLVRTSARQQTQPSRNIKSTQPKKLCTKKLDLTAHKELAQAAAGVNPGATTNNNMDEDVDGLEAPFTQNSPSPPPRASGQPN